jgi:hypothetical protein
VVHDEYKDVILVTEPEQFGAQKGAPAEIERPAGIFAGESKSGLLSISVRQVSEIYRGQLKRKMGQYNLFWFTIQKGEDSPYRLVTRNDGLKGLG